MHTIDFYRPKTTAEFAEILQSTGGRIVAGCTDVLPRARRAGSRLIVW